MAPLKGSVKNALSKGLTVKLYAAPVDGMWKSSPTKEVAAEPKYAEINAEGPVKGEGVGDLMSDSLPTLKSTPQKSGEPTVAVNTHMLASIDADVIELIVVGEGTR